MALDDENWQWSDSDGEEEPPVYHKIVDGGGGVPHQKMGSGYAGPGGVDAQQQQQQQQHQGQQASPPGPRMPGTMQPRPVHEGVKQALDQMVVMGHCSRHGAGLFTSLLAQVVSTTSSSSSPGGMMDTGYLRGRAEQAERLLKESEEREMQLNTKLMHALSSQADLSSSNADRTINAGRITELQQQVFDLQARAARSTEVVSKMEELMRLQEAALQERDEVIRSAGDGASDAERRAVEAQAEAKAANARLSEALARAEELEASLEDVKDALRRVDQEKVRLHEEQLEDKEEKIRMLEARILAQGGDKAEEIVAELASQLKMRDEQVSGLQAEVFGARSAVSEAEELHKALSLRVTMQAEQRAELEEQLSALEVQTRSLEAALSQLRVAASPPTPPPGSSETAPGVGASAFAPQQLEQAHREIARRDMQLASLQDALDQIQYAMDRAQQSVSERDQRVTMLESALDQTQPAMAMARKSIEERDLKIDGLLVLLKAVEDQVGEQHKRIEEAAAVIASKDEEIKNLNQMLRGAQSQPGQSQSQPQQAPPPTSTVEYDDVPSTSHGRIQRKVSFEHGLTTSSSVAKRLDYPLVGGEQQQPGAASASPHTSPARESGGEGASASAAPAVVQIIDTVVVRPEGGGVERPLQAMRSIGFGTVKDVRGICCRASPFTAEANLDNVADIRGNIAIVRRGGVPFVEKCRRLQLAGAVGIIIVNTDAKLYQPAAQLPNTDINLPIMCVSGHDEPLLTDGTWVMLVFSNPGASKSPSAGRGEVAAPKPTKAPSSNVCFAESLDGVEKTSPSPNSNEGHQQQQQQQQQQHASPSNNSHVHLQPPPSPPPNTLPTQTLPFLDSNDPNYPTDPFAANSFVVSGGNVVEIKRQFLTGATSRTKSFWKVDAQSGLLISKHRTVQLLSASDALPEAATSAFKQSKDESLRTFVVRAYPVGGPITASKEPPQRLELILMSPTLEERRLWVAGINAIVASKGSTGTPTYTGELKKGLPDGRGIGVWNDGGRYVGEWQDGMLSGYGVYEWPTGDSYAGQWSKGVRSGSGMLQCSDGSVFQGLWALDRKHGMGVEANAVGETFVGRWSKGARVDEAVNTKANGDSMCLLFSGGNETFVGFHPVQDPAMAARYARVIQDGNVSAKDAASCASIARSVLKELDRTVDKVTGAPIRSLASSSSSPSPVRGLGGSTGGSPSTRSRASPAH